MRKIIQIFVLLFAANLTITGISAQLPKLPKVLVFANGQYASPVNDDFKKFCNYGYGFEVGAGIGLGKTILIASTGQLIYNFPERTVNGFVVSGHETFKFTPLKFGMRQYLIAGLFLTGQLGVAMRSNNSSQFLYEGGAGFKLGFFEVAAAYTGHKFGDGNIFNANSLLLKAGLALKL
jgi:hypothetical protein